jgi:hypothetical protein
MAGQIFYGLFFWGGVEAGTLKDLKIGWSRGFKQINMIGSDFTSGEKQGKDYIVQELTLTCFNIPK